MISFEEWKKAYIAAVSQAFGPRIVCAGMQGSQARGEAREDSDIDTVLVLDHMTSTDLYDYRSLIRNLPNADLICGFVSDRETLEHWDSGELVSFYFDTVCLLGNLDFLHPRFSRDAARRNVHQSACALFHALCHASVFEPEPLDSRAFAKGIYFLLRTKCYAETGEFHLRLDHLLLRLNDTERALLSSLVDGQDWQSHQNAGRDAALALLAQWIGDSQRGR